ncbi:MAG: hypothetical protein K0R15_153 [Clostridiales bacterium]|jgi:hypothetical protein|nr:hypothetical protein [Clostridiales bacterium]
MMSTRRGFGLGLLLFFGSFIAILFDLLGM